MKRGKNIAHNENSIGTDTAFWKCVLCTWEMAYPSGSGVRATSERVVVEKAREREQGRIG